MSSFHSPVSMVNPLLGMNAFLDSHLREQKVGVKRHRSEIKAFSLFSQWGVLLCLSAPWYSEPCGLWALEGKRRNCPGCVSGIWPTLECHGFSLARVHAQQLFLIWKLISWVVLAFQNWLCHLKVNLVAEFHRHRAPLRAEACREAGTVGYPWEGTDEPCTQCGAWTFWHLEDALLATKLAKNVAS